MSTTTKAIGYCRVSSQEQKYGQNVALQVAAIKRHAKAEGWRLVDVCLDEARSGSNGLDNREGLADALAACEGGRADVLVVTEYSRLARDLIIQETTIQRLGAVGVRVIAIDEPEVGGDDHTRTLVRQVLGAVKQYERAVIRARMEAGRARAIAEGRRGQGQPPYGYRADGAGGLVPEPAEQATLASMRAWKAEGVPLAEIARRLNAEGVQARRGSWHPTSVSRVLARR